MQFSKDRFYKFFFKVILCILLFNQPAKGQLVDTIKYSLQQKPKFFATLASFNTFIDHEYTHIFRVKAGLTYNRKIRFGIGYSNLTNQIVSDIHIEESGLDYYTKGELDFSFFSLSAEYFFYYDYPWQCTVTPFDIGIGGANYRYVDRITHKYSYTPTETIILYQPEVSVQYNIFTWFGLGLTTGYRFTVYRSLKDTQGLNAPTFALDFRLFLDEIYKELFEKDKKIE